MSDPTVQEDFIYRGEEKLVLAFDIGTTQTAVAFVHLYPGFVPQVRLVNKWPGQEDAAGDCKLPTLVAYEGTQPVAYGVEAEEREVDDNIHLARWFKLHLHPESMRRSTEPPVYGMGNRSPPGLEIPPLPPSISAKQVYAHFMTYIFNHTREFFKDNTVDGAQIWSRLSPNFTLVLATPNGWDTSQHVFLKEAAVRGGLLPEAFDDSRLEFVTEGEASVHYALEKTNGHTWLRKDVVFIVCDVGGSTVDSTLYRCKDTDPKLVLEEVCASECVQAGAVFVDRAGEAVIRRKLGTSRFAQDMYVMDMVREFEKKTKRKFDGTQLSNIINFGWDADTDRSVGVIKGRLTLTKQEVEEAFNASVPRIIGSAKRLAISSGGRLKHLLLVGGMGESPYLRKKLKESFRSDGVDVVTVDDSTKKAAAEGAAIWFAKQLVAARAAKSTFGTIIAYPYNPQLATHRARRRWVLTDLSGARIVPGGWSTWIKKNQIVGNALSQTFDYQLFYSSINEELGNHTLDVFAIDSDETIDWVEDENGREDHRLRSVCSLRADMSNLRHSLQARVNSSGHRYYSLEFSVKVLLGGTSLRARLVWDDNGIRREGPVTVIPNSMSS